MKQTDLLNDDVPSRTLHWVSSVDPTQKARLERLQAKLVAFYTKSPSYYGDIDFTAEAWRNDPIYRDIAVRLRPCRSILEVGCGAANILRYYPDLVSRYHGCDFSPALMEKNRRRWPTAAFSRISDPARLPFDDQLFDAVFSVFVIEHTVYPMHFLNECVRVLRLGGVFLLRCPNFLAEGKLTSQRAGSSMGTGREKLRHGALIDALLTFWDRKIRIPRRCADVRRKIGAGWGFYVNLAPVCFVDPFAPDHDAVYLTYSREMIGYLQDRVLFSHPATELADRGSIYLTGKRFGVTA